MKRLLPPRPPGILLIAGACCTAAVFLVITGTLTSFGRLPLRSGAFLLEGFELMGPLIFFLVASLALIVGLALLKPWTLGRRIAIILFALFGFAAIPSVSSAVMEFRWLTLCGEGLKLLSSVLAIFYLLQPDVIDYFQPASAKKAASEERRIL